MTYEGNKQQVIPQLSIGSRNEDYDLTTKKDSFGSFKGFSWNWSHKNYFRKMVKELGGAFLTQKKSILSKESGCLRPKINEFVMLWQDK